MSSCTDVESSPPQVSILLPVFNAAPTLAACLRSVLRSDFADWECLILDDGSTDDSREVAQTFVAQDVRFRLLTLPHRGLVQTLNTGLDAARGVFLARLDADDVQHRKRLTRQLEALQAEPEAGVVGCHVRMFPRASLQPGRRAYEGWLNAFRSSEALHRERFIECPLAHPTLLFRGEVLRTLRYRDLGWPEDYDLLLRMVEADIGLTVVPERLLAWRDLPSRLSRTHAAYRLERFMACRSAFLASGPLRDWSRYVLWGHGPTGRALRRALVGHGKHAQAILEVHPRRIGQVIGGARVFGLEAIPALGNLPILVAVSGLEARALIRAHLQEVGRVEGVDTFFAA